MIYTNLQPSTRMLSQCSSQPVRLRYPSTDYPLFLLLHLLQLPSFQHHAYFSLALLLSLEPPSASTSGQPRNTGAIYQPNKLPPPPPFLPPRLASFSNHSRRTSFFCISAGLNSLVSNCASCLLNASSVGRLVIYHPLAHIPHPPLGETQNSPGMSAANPQSACCPSRPRRTPARPRPRPRARLQSAAAQAA